MAVKEAIAAGKPVIAPCVGWCWEHPVIEYDSDDDLVMKISKLAPPVADPWEELTDWVLGLAKE